MLPDWDVDFDMSFPSWEPVCRSGLASTAQRRFKKIAGLCFCNGIMRRNHIGFDLRPHRTFIAKPEIN
jgi:hypothetical protein